MEIYLGFHGDLALDFIRLDLPLPLSLSNKQSILFITTFTPSLFCGAKTQRMAITAFVTLSGIMKCLPAQHVA